MLWLFGCPKNPWSTFGWACTRIHSSVRRPASFSSRHAARVATEDIVWTLEFFSNFIEEKCHLRLSDPVIIDHHRTPPHTHTHTHTPMLNLFYISCFISACMRTLERELEDHVVVVHLGGPERLGRELRVVDSVHVAHGLQAEPPVLVVHPCRPSRRCGSASCPCRAAWWAGSPTAPTPCRTPGPGPVPPAASLRRRRCSWRRTRRCGRP